MRRLLFTVSLSLIACKASTTTPPGDNPDAAKEFKDAAVLSGTEYSLTWGPVTVQPHVENTQCVILKLSNTTEIKVHQIHNTLGPGSHHVIVYKDDMDTTEQTTPVDCQPFTGALNLSGMVAPLMITQRQDDPLTLPEGVAYTLKASQFIRIEMHYINSGDSPITAMAQTDFYAADPATIHDEANILFIGSPDITLPPNQMTSLNEFFSPSRAGLNLDNAKFFAITGHEHHLGTNVEVNTAPTNGGTKTPVYNPSPFQWAEPTTQIWAPEFQVPSGGGFDFTCTWYNSTAATVKFGESANNEMCFFWAYYYPSQGAHVCVHSNQFGVDICCPEAGANLCNMLNRP